MADTSLPSLRRFKPDWAIVALFAIPIIVAMLDAPALGDLVQVAVGAFLHTLPFLLFAVLAVAWLKATGAENLLGRAFEGREVRMIVLAALAGGLSPFCSCQVIPFIAAMLAIGAPLSAVMAFWLASPLMDPPMFLIPAGALGFPFAIAKTAAAVTLGLGGGFFVRAFSASALFANPLKATPAAASGCGCESEALVTAAPTCACESEAKAFIIPDEPAPASASCGCAPTTSTEMAGESCAPAPGTRLFSAKPVWAFWREARRRTTFVDVAVENLLFLGKWLALAYALEALMLRYVPPSLVGGFLGGDGPLPVLLAALVGAPAYLNGYAAVPLVAGLVQQGMSQGAAMAFVIAGGVSCIPAAVAVWALVKPRVFAAYLGLAFVGSLGAGFAWSALSALIA